MNVSLEELNSRYSSKNLKFRLQNGFPVADVQGAGSKASIALHGGQIMEWQPEGRKPVLWTCPVEPVISQGKAIRGGVPICWPWFGAHPSDTAKPMHGSARLADWEFVSFENATVTLRHMDGGPLLATVKIIIGKTLEVLLETVNTSSSEIKFNAGLHSYFAIGGLEKLRVTGLENINYFDKLAGHMDIHSGPLTFGPPVTHIYKGAKEAIIDDPSMKRKIRVGASGSDSIVVWNPGPGAEKLFPGFAVGDENRFVCVESAIVTQIPLKPSGKLVLGTSIEEL